MREIAKSGAEVVSDGVQPSSGPNMDLQTYRRMNAQPLPCPFCGGPAEAQKVGARQILWRVGCIDKACLGRQTIYSSYGWTERGEAVAAWNKRATTQGHPHHQSLRMKGADL